MSWASNSVNGGGPLNETTLAPPRVPGFSGFWAFLYVLPVQKKGKGLVKASDMVVEEKSPRRRGYCFEED